VTGRQIPYKKKRTIDSNLFFIKCPLRMLTKDPNERPSAEAILIELDYILASLTS
jgi:hypothetical protein